MSTPAGPNLRTPLTPAALDAFVPRRRLAAALEAAGARFHGTVLDVGCGDQPYRDWILSTTRATAYIGVDLFNPLYGGPDVAWDGIRLPVGDASVQTVLLTEVLEHCPDPAGVLDECLRVLAPGGVLYLTVPFLWPLHDAPHDEHRFTPFALERLLRHAGFDELNIDALGGWDAAVAQLLALWARRRFRGRKRRLVSFALLPMIALLDRHDQPPTRFTNSTMVTGLAATARRPRPAGSAVESEQTP